MDREAAWTTTLSTMAGKRGFAVFGTDNGHTGKYLTTPGVLEDYSPRAIHVGGILGKKAPQLFYGRSHHRAY